ncbi:hypothetical protein ACTMU2_36760 [Cupriavidus basilensis]
MRRFTKAGPRGHHDKLARLPDAVDRRAPACHPPQRRCRYALETERIEGWPQRLLEAARINPALALEVVAVTVPAPGRGGL